MRQYNHSTELTQLGVQQSEDVRYNKEGDKEVRIQNG